VARLWFYLGTLASSINKADRNCIAELLLKVALNTIALSVTPRLDRMSFYLNTFILKIYEVVSFIPFGIFGFYFDNWCGQDTNNSILFERSVYYQGTINRKVDAMEIK
jgi:hypothetical protein